MVTSLFDNWLLSFSIHPLLKFKDSVLHKFYLSLNLSKKEILIYKNKQLKCLITMYIYRC